MDKKDIENIVTAMEIFTEEYLRRMEAMREKLQAYENKFGKLKKNYRERLEDVFSLIEIY